MKDSIILILFIACISLCVFSIDNLTEIKAQAETIKSQKETIVEMSRMMPPEQDRKWSTKESILKSVGGE
jgi:hypothetical protein